MDISVVDQAKVGEAILVKAQHIRCAYYCRVNVLDLWLIGCKTEFGYQVTPAADGQKTGVAVSVHSAR